MNTIPHGPLKKDPHAVALGRRGGQAKSEAKAAASRDRMVAQWQHWKANGGRPRPVAGAVPEEYRDWVLGLAKVDLAELAWMLAEDLYECRGAERGQAREAFNAEVRELVREYGECRLSRAKGSEYCKTSR